MVGDGLHPRSDLRAAVSAGGRVFAAQPVPGSGLGLALGLGVLAATFDAARTALDWMPGRILVLADDGLVENCQERVARSAHLRTLSGIVILADEEIDLSALGSVGSSVPMVRIARSHDQRCLRRAVRIGVEVRHGVPQVDLRPHSFRQARQPGARADSAPPGTPAH